MYLNIQRKSSLIVNRILEYCNAKFSIECNSIHLEAVFEFYKSNSTKLYLIPINSKHIRYLENFKSDINELIYNLGGIIGLWFGLSSISLINLIVFVFNDISKLFHKCKQFILKEHFADLNHGFR